MTNEREPESKDKVAERQYASSLDQKTGKEQS
jgi:hypothetical protein